MRRDPVICDCQRVTLAAVDSAIERGARSVGAVGSATGAGTGCGQCRADIRRRLRWAWLRRLVGPTRRR